VTGVANAYAARSPLLLIGGAAPLALRGLGALQETEQVAFDPAAYRQSGQVSMAI
jgi:thiamine pyrophosphate-dependent acetolactate synthase large subunit-like protein